MRTVFVKLTNIASGLQSYSDENVGWTNSEGYLRISYGNRDVAEYRPEAWSYVFVREDNETQPE